MWFGRENDENVVRTRDCCGWPSSPRELLNKNSPGGSVRGGVTK